MFTLRVAQTTDFNPADSTEYWVGTDGAAPGLTVGYPVRTTLFPVAVTLVAARLRLRTDVGASGETIQFVARNLFEPRTENIGSATAWNVAGEANVLDTAMSMAVGVAMEFAISFTTPAWVTNPTNVGLDGILMFTVDSEVIAIAAQDASVLANDSDISGILAGDSLDINGLPYAGQLTAEEIASLRSPDINLQRSVSRSLLKGRSQVLETYP